MISDDEVQEYIDGMVLEEGRKEHFGLREKEKLGQALFRSVRRLDVLQELLDDPEITEIMVNGPEDIFIEKNGRMERWPGGFLSCERLETVIQMIVGMTNRMVNEQQPIADARLPDGRTRVNVVLPPVSLNGPTMTIRRFPPESLTMESLIEKDSISAEAAAFLGDLVEAKYSILIGGGTSTGKTTFLNALSACIPHEERVVTIEDNAELQIQGISNLVRLEVKPPNLEGGTGVGIRELLKTALRMRPDRIIIGEVRGKEAGDFLNCLNTGHDGSLGTAHANSVRDMITRLETMVLMGISLPVPVIRRQIALGIRILVHLSRDWEGRRQVEEIAEITGMEGEEVRIHPLFRRERLLLRKDAEDGEHGKKPDGKEICQEFGRDALCPCGDLQDRERLEKLYEKRRKEKKKGKGADAVCG